MRYFLDSDYYFCGWDATPFAVTSDNSRQPHFLTREKFLALWNCDGHTEIDREALDEETRKFLDWALREGIIHEAHEDMRQQIHDYKKFPCRYRQEVQLSITGKCNYKCRHCLQSAPHGVLGEPTTEEVCAELDQLAECGVHDVSITGGEPLIHEGFWDIVDHMQELGLRLVTVYSNGKLVDQDLIDGLKNRGMRPTWQISFDGLGVHDWIRGAEGAEERAIDAIKLLVANDFPVGCAYTLTKRTAPAFRETVNFLASIGVHSIKSGETQMQGEWLDQPKEWLTDEEYLNFYKEYIPQFFADGRPMDVQFEGLFNGFSDEMLSLSPDERAALKDTEDYGAAKVVKGDMDVACETLEEAPDEPTYEFMTEEALTEEQCANMLSCGVLGTAFYIGPTGRVLPCMGMDDTPVGNEFSTLWEVPLREILSEGSRFIEATGYTIKDVFDHNPECADCEQRAYCGSGCRAGAIGANGTDYLAIDKRACLLCKEDWAGKIRQAIGAAIGE